MQEITQQNYARPCERFSSFAELSFSYREGAAFEICSRKGTSGTAIIAPHGGSIEPGTTEIADAVAGREHDFYSFKSLLPAQASWDLHLTSANFDEPRARAIVAEATRVVAIHVCKGSEEKIYLGGLDAVLGEKIGAALHESCYAVGRHPNPFLQGKSVLNICNLGREQAGVQLEISNGLIVRFELNSPEGPNQDFAHFVAALRRALQ